jgi:hypothetical protein
MSGGREVLVRKGRAEVVHELGGSRLLAARARTAALLCSSVVGSLVS